MNRTSIKILAKTNLNGKSFRSFWVWILPLLFAVGDGILCHILLRCGRTNLRQDWILLVAQSVWGCAAFLLCAALRQGREAWFVCTASGRDPSAWQLLYWLRPGKSVRALHVHTCVAIRKAGWYIAFLLPGFILFGTEIYRAKYAQSMDVLSMIGCAGGFICIVTGGVFAAILCQKYSMVFLLLSLEPNTKTIDLIRKSAALTDGKCMRLFAFELSFLPWLFSCATVFPIFYSVPYHRTSTTCMRLSLLN